MRTHARLRVTLLAAFVVVVIMAGCAGPAVGAATASPASGFARVELVNLSDYDWHIAVVLASGSEAWSGRLPAHQTLRFQVPGADYTITQTALNGLTGPEAERRFPTHLEPGENYRWRIATLLTGQTGAAP